MSGISKKIKQFVSSTSLNQKFNIIIGVSILICFIVSSTLSMFVFSQYNKLLYKSTSYILHKTIIDIENDLERVEELTTAIIADKIIQTQLPFLTIKESKTAYSAAVTNIYSSLQKYHTNKDVVSISIETDNKQIFTGANYIDSKREVIDNAIMKAKNSDGRPVWLASGKNDYNIICAREIRQIENLTLNSMGVLVIHINLKGIVNKSLKHYNQLDFSPYISVVSENEIIFATSDLIDGIDKVKKNNTDDGYYQTTINKKRYFVTTVQSEFVPWQYTLYLPFDEIDKSIRDLKIAMVVLMIVVALIAFCLSIKLVSSIIKHFDVLVMKMERFKKGIFTIDTKYDYSDRSDELGFLHRNFDEMVEETKRLINDNYVKQLLIKESQLKSLQQQVNPHFLFNMLQTVNWIAKSNEQTEISLIVEAAGKILRYTLSEKRNVVLLEKELETTKCYIQIQKFRYKERLEAEIDIPESLYHQKIPKMALQAIVENAINHALENMIGTCMIKISAVETDNTFILSVEDNGPGIDVDIINKLENNEIQPSGLGIGLLNIHKRIKLLFSEEYGVEVFNTGNGTKVVIKLPLEQQNEEE